MLKKLVVIMGLITCLLLVSCVSKPPVQQFTVDSTALSAEGRLSLVYGASPDQAGSQQSFPFNWHNPPAGTKAIALVLCDKSFGDFVHWIATDLDPALGGLADDASTHFFDFSQGVNDVGRFGYYGPQPSGTNIYRLTLYALSEKTELEPRFTLDDLKAAMEGKILSQTSLDMSYSAY